VRSPFFIPPFDAATVELHARIDEVLESAVNALAARLGPDAGGALPLVDALGEAVLSGGKRFRPILCVWGYRAGGGHDEEAIARAAAALELVHVFAIVQDDLMDDARVRRGQPALHVRLAEIPTEQGGGAAQALLVADLAMILADELLAHAPFPAERIVQAFGPFNRMRFDAIAGQYLDLIGSDDLRETDETEAARIGALKTGGYTVEGPLFVGAALAGADKGVADALLRYGRAVGRAFQIRDDVLGAFGDESDTGKDAGADLRRRKPTVLLAKALRSASEAERRFFEARLGRPDLTEGELEQVRQVIISSGALEETLLLIRSLLREAKGAVDVLSIPAPARDGLRSLADLLALNPA
jgi:geranylgeranyl diphosphate synthase type I